MKCAAKARTKPRVLLLQTADGETKLTVPPGFKVTWGPSIPGAAGSLRNAGTRMEYALRVYDGTELIAAFTQVYQFWDLSLELVFSEKNLDNAVAFAAKQGGVQWGFSGLLTAGDSVLTGTTWTTYPGTHAVLTGITDDNCDTKISL
jgi:hypothetical protein